MKIFYIFGKSGTGKDTIRSNLLKVTDLKLEPFLMATDRPKRPGESDGNQYFFKTKEEFDKMLDNGELDRDNIEVYNVYQDGKEDVWRFGVYKLDTDNDTNYIGIGSLNAYLITKKIYGDIVIPIYIDLPEDVRLNRLILRDGNNKNKLKEICRRYISECDEYDPQILNDLHLPRQSVFKNDLLIDTLNKIIAYIKREGRK